jgi:hypothetical protein
MLGKKAIACLQMAALRPDEPERRRLYEAACSRWSEKAVCAKFEELISKGYIGCGISARSGWLTARGRSALNEANHCD